MNLHLAEQRDRRNDTWMSGVTAKKPGCRYLLFSVIETTDYDNKTHCPMNRAMNRHLPKQCDNGDYTVMSGVTVKTRLQIFIVQDNRP